MLCRLANDIECIDVALIISMQQVEYQRKHTVELENLAKDWSARGKVEQPNVTKSCIGGINARLHNKA
ncbi:hypothetical protein ACMUMQ_11740 [Marinomonas sp. 2405UD66-6]|uniref:hypothetical protein n=1 Tax=Marinomonas sp. 2405UD66-6 TaxID=3391834 RepID=UPI0039C94F91